ncbi:hypothetical protein WNZ15_07295 [Roseibium sp. AS2]|uniref:hypothetical protein n=1 Tax=Roseibium sp. AS2 TaxID=3135781 RepID=UPI00317DB9BF
MHRSFRSLFPASRLKAGLKAAPALLAAIALTACQTETTQVSDLLFAPTFSKSRQYLPNTYNTQYDCRAFTGSGWKGIASGRVEYFDERYMISQAGCFRTKNECEAWLSLMRGYIDIPRFIRCNPYSA